MASEWSGESTSMNGSMVEDDSATLDSLVSAVESDMALKLFSEDSAHYDDSNDWFDAVFFGSELEERIEDSAYRSQRKESRLAVRAELIAISYMIFI